MGACVAKNRNKQNKEQNSHLHQSQNMFEETGQAPSYQIETLNAFNQQDYIKKWNSDMLKMKGSETKTTQQNTNSILQDIRPLRKSIQLRTPSNMNEAEYIKSLDKIYRESSDEDKEPQVKQSRRQSVQVRRIKHFQTQNIENDEYATVKNQGMDKRKQKGNTNLNKIKETKKVPQVDQSEIECDNIVEN